jgi:hypothetical protein
MWALVGSFRYSKCGRVQGIWQRARRSPHRASLGVCRDCLGFWERTGHRCGRCWYPVQTQWDLGLLIDRGVFAHVDCGGALLLPIGRSGRLTPAAPVPGSGAIDATALQEGRLPGEEAAPEPRGANPSLEK